MAVHEIIKMGNPVLATIAEPVTDPCAPEIQELVSDMRDSLEAVGGVGLAAPQIGVPLQVILFAVPAARLAKEDGLSEEDDPDAPGDVDETVLINPKLTFPGNAITKGWEGCLSVPGWRGLVPRHEELIYSGHDLGGRLIERQVSGFHARLVQHEYDHLIGRLYPTRMTDLSYLVYESEWQAFMQHQIDEAGKEKDSQDHD